MGIYEDMTVLCFLSYRVAHKSNFSIDTLVSQRRKIREYFAPERYIPSRKTRCDIPYTMGPPIVTNQGLCSLIDRTPRAVTAGQPMTKLQTIAKTPARISGVGFSLNADRSARSSILELT